MTPCCIMKVQAVRSTIARHLHAFEGLGTDSLQTWRSAGCIPCTLLLFPLPEHMFGRPLSASHAGLRNLLWAGLPSAGLCEPRPESGVGFGLAGVFLGMTYCRESANPSFAQDQLFIYTESFMESASAQKHDMHLLPLRSRLLSAS